MKFSAIILAAGSGARMGLNYNKVFYKINDKRVLDYSLEFFKKYRFCEEIILVASDNDFNFVYGEYNDQVDAIIVGGNTRQESVRKGLNKANSSYVLVHDSARPHINLQKIDDLVADVQLTKASTLAVSVTDTIVKTRGNRLSKTLNRNELIALQTPQAFRTDILKEAHKKARKLKYTATDDTDLVRKFTDIMPSYVIGDYRSIKLTTKEDVKFLEVIL